MSGWLNAGNSLKALIILSNILEHFDKSQISTEVLLALIS